MREDALSKNPAVRTSRDAMPRMDIPKILTTIGVYYKQIVDIGTGS